jgi:polysaccharide export outer membrane protein
MSRTKYLGILAGLALGAASPASAQQSPGTEAVAAEARIPLYRIGPGDVLQVDIWKEPDASVPSVTVRPDGRIALPMVGEVLVAGLTPVDLQKSLVTEFGALIREPRVTVTVRDVNSQRIYVIGEVRREGPVRFIGPLTILQALAEAGGITDYAKRKKIYVLRVAGGRQVRLPFDYDAVVKGQKVEQNVTLLSGDTIVVPR